MNDVIRMDTAELERIAQRLRRLSDEMDVLTGMVRRVQYRLEIAPTARLETMCAMLESRMRLLTQTIFEIAQSVEEVAGTFSRCEESLVGRIASC